MTTRRGWPRAACRRMRHALEPLFPEIHDRVGSLLGHPSERPSDRLDLRRAGAAGEEPELVASRRADQVLYGPLGGLAHRDRVSQVGVGVHGGGDHDSPHLVLVRVGTERPSLAHLDDAAPPKADRGRAGAVPVQDRPFDEHRSGRRRAAPA